MVAELSITNEITQNNTSSMNEITEEDEIMMDVDGHANNASAGLSQPLDGSAIGDENEVGATVDKICEYYIKGTTDEADAADVVDTVIIFDTLESVDAVNTNDTTDTNEQCDFMSLRVIDEYLESEDFNPTLESTQEQLLIINWLTSLNGFNE
ncbi:uncharacterized protein [Maniola hyperantus]|uniref:uncharacterized protein n=1 Tax=Aphantopus hyperantus TaxID=2795564 RepID=UPI0021450AD1